MEVSGKVTSTSETNFNLYCIPCDTDGLKKPAHGFCQDCQEHLCKSCFKHHRRSRPSRNHVLLEKDVMPTQQTNVDEVNADVITDENIKDAYEKIAEKVKRSQSFINDLNNTNKQNKLFIEIKNTTPRVMTLENEEIQIIKDNMTYDDIQFDRNEKLLDQLRSGKIFGTILTYRKPSADTELCVTYEKSLNVKFPSDEKKGDVTGAVMISVTQMIIADCSNNKVKMINIDTGMLVSEKDLSSAPRDVIKLPQNKLAAALLHEKCIQILSYTDTSLSLDRRIDVGESCYCVGYCQDKLVVGCNYNPGKLVVLDLDGKIIQVFDTPGLLAGPEKILISSNEKFLYVVDYMSDNDSKCIKIDWQGNVVQRFEDQGCKGPLGIQEMEDGSLLVCCYGSHKIVRLSSSLKACEINGLEEINLYCPKTVTYSKMNHKFYISCSSVYRQISNGTIKVFNVR